MADIDNLPLTSSHWGTCAVEAKDGREETRERRIS